MSSVGIIGAGPAGLSAAYKLREFGMESTVYEQDPKYVGGISRTVEHKGYRFDIGGHRFFSKSDIVEQFWADVLKERLIERKRLSRIFYNDKFFNYPLSPYEAFNKLGLIYSAACFFSYLKSKLFPIRNVKSFEDWIINNFGKKLYMTFFKTYTEKVWGVPCSELSADWAAQRIKGLSFYSLIISLFKKQSGKGGNKKVIKTLIDSFRYPELGPGMFWEVITEILNDKKKTVQMDKDVIGIEKVGDKMCVTLKSSDGSTETAEYDHLISSMPVKKLLEAIATKTELPAEVKSAMNQLKYRDFMIVSIVVDNPDLFPDNWIYIHDPRVKVGRIQNFKNWSPKMVPNDSKTCLGMEYFCDKGDDLWSMSDKDTVELAKKEVKELGLVAKDATITDGFIQRVPKAYPFYDDNYKAHMQVIRDYLESNYPNLQLVGRNGMHKYNNQDHAIMTGFLAAGNIHNPNEKMDLWNVNQDASYHEEVSDEKEKELQ